MTQIRKYLDPDLIVRLDATSRDDTLQTLVDVCESSGRLEGKDLFHTKILERERIVSTGIGMGVAIPHAKLPGYKTFFIAIGISEEGIEWNSLDKHPVRLVFMIGGPDDKQTEYLQILSQLTLAIKDEQRRKILLTLSEPEAIIAQFEGF